MTQTTAVIVPVVEEHDHNPYGQFTRQFEFPRVPQAGEMLLVAGYATRVQDVLWYADDTTGLGRAEVFVSARPLGPGFPETVNQLFDAGFFPMNPDGSTRTWEEDQELRTAMTNEGITLEPVPAEPEPSPVEG